MPTFVNQFRFDNHLVQRNSKSIGNCFGSVKIRASFPALQKADVGLVQTYDTYRNLLSKGRLSMLS